MKYTEAVAHCDTVAKTAGLKRNTRAYRCTFGQEMRRIRAAQTQATRTAWDSQEQAAEAQMWERKREKKAVAA